jgi:hypothetical protein
VDVNWIFRTPLLFILAVSASIVCASEESATGEATCEAQNAIASVIATTSSTISQSEDLARDLAERAQAIQEDYRVCEKDAACSNSRRYVELAGAVKNAFVQRRRVEELVVDLKSRKAALEVQAGLLKGAAAAKNCPTQ